MLFLVHLCMQAVGQAQPEKDSFEHLKKEQETDFYQNEQLSVQMNGSYVWDHF